MFYVELRFCFRVTLAEENARCVNVDEEEKQNLVEPERSCVYGGKENHQKNITGMNTRKNNELIK